MSSKRVVVRNSRRGNVHGRSTNDTANVPIDTTRADTAYPSRVGGSLKATVPVGMSETAANTEHNSAG